jgi:hypothetical protein
MKVFRTFLIGLICIIASGVCGLLAAGVLQQGAALVGGG